MKGNKMADLKTKPTNKKAKQHTQTWKNANKTPHKQKKKGWRFLTTIISQKEFISYQKAYCHIYIIIYDHYLHSIKKSLAESGHRLNPRNILIWPSLDCIKDLKAAAGMKALNMCNRNSSCTEIFVLPVNLHSMMTFLLTNA